MKLSRKATYEVSGYFYSSTEEMPEIWEIIWVSGSPNAQINSGRYGHYDFLDLSASENQTQEEILEMLSTMLTDYVGSFGLQKGGV